MTIFLALAMLIGAGGNALCALRLGEGKHDEAEHILGNTAMMAVLVSAVLAVLAHIPFIVEPVLTLSSATDTVRPYAREFIQIVSLGCIFQIVGMGLNNFIRTAGAPNRALVTMLIGAIGCTVFNAVFVLWWGWGVAGSAWATVCGQAISCATVISVFHEDPGRAAASAPPLFPGQGQARPRHPVAGRGVVRRAGRRRRGELLHQLHACEIRRARPDRRRRCAGVGRRGAAHRHVRHSAADRRFDRHPAAAWLQLRREAVGTA